MDKFPYDIRLGYDGIGKHGAFYVISEGTLLAIKLLSINPEELLDADTITRKHPRISHLIFVGDNLGAGLPYYLFDYLGMKEKFVKPRIWWLLLNRNFDTHIHFVELYYKQLKALDL